MAEPEGGPTIWDTLLIASTLVLAIGWALTTWLWR